MARDLTLGPEWSHVMYERLKAEGVSIFAWVPDGGHKVPIARSLEDDDSVLDRAVSLEAVVRRDRSGQ